MRTVIGVDIGTQGTKAVLFDETGRARASAFEPSRLHRPRPGVVEEDPERQFASVCRTMAECLRRSRLDGRSVAAVGVAGQMAGVLGVGADGRAVTPYDSWLDTRCGPYIKQMDQRAGAEINASAGNPPSFNHGPKKLWWLHERPEVYRRIAAFVQPGGYAAMRLCGLGGGEALVDTTYLHFSGFADTRQCRWNERLVDEFGFDGAKLPRIVEPQQVIGQLTRQAARKCGLPAGVPVVAGCGDTAASFLACGATRPGVCVDVAGTASVFAATTDRFLPDLEHRVLGCGHSATPGLWHPYAYIGGGGMNLEWFRGQLGGLGRKPVEFETLAALAAAIRPAPADPLFIPHLGGRVSPAQPELRGAWVGLTWDATLGHLYRSVLEAVALEYVLYRNVLAELDPAFRMAELRITGGGEQSALWNSIKADALQCPVRRVGRTEGAPLGAALVAAWGVGLVRSLPEGAKRWITLAAATKPRKHLAGHYAQRAAAYARLLKTLDGAIPNHDSR